jgi:homoserine dehydrogenase
MRKIINIGLIGFGNVGRELARILLEKENEWAEDKSSLFRISAISTRSRGALANRQGIDLNRALNDINLTGSFNSENPDYQVLTAAELTKLDFIDLVVEITTLNIKNGQPAADHIKSALLNNKDVITANKGPLAFYYDDLLALARKVGRQFLFEGTVMDGTPIFNLVRETLPACTISGFKGILNSTTNYILTEMAAGKSFEAALKKAQKQGFVESDPALDLDGWDAAAKVAVLMNVFLNAAITPPEIDRTGIGAVSQDELDKAKKAGKTIRLICEGYRKGNDYYGTVKPVAIPKTEPLAQIRGTSSALTIFTDLAGVITIESHNPQIQQTAYALISDLFAIAKHCR